MPTSFTEKLPWWRKSRDKVGGEREGQMFIICDFGRSRRGKVAAW